MDISDPFQCMASGRHVTVASAFGELWYVALYVVSMLVLGLHLLHGFASGFRTIGVHHRRYWQCLSWFANQQ